MPTIRQADIAEAITRWAAYIDRNATAEPLGLVGLISHGDALAHRLADILRQNGRRVLCGAIDITLYRDDIDLRRARPALRSSDLPFSTDDMQLILIDDVIRSGRTARAALETVFEYGRPARVELHCLVDRGERELPIQPDYVSFRADGSSDVRVLLQEQDGQDAVTF